MGYLLAQQLATAGSKRGRPSRLQGTTVYTTPQKTQQWRARLQPLDTMNKEDSICANGVRLPGRSRLRINANMHGCTSVIVIIGSKSRFRIKRIPFMAALTYILY
jgi:hypothetical protein